MCTHSQNCKCTDLYQHVHSLTNLEVPDLRRNILTGCWQRTQHPDSTRPSQSFHSQPHTHVYTHSQNCTRTLTHKSRGTWLETQHLDRLLTTDATSRQHKTLSKLSLTAIYMYTCTHSQKIIAVTHVHSITKLGVLDLRTNLKFIHRYTYSFTHAHHTHDFTAESTVTCTLKMSSKC